MADPSFILLEILTWCGRLSFTDYIEVFVGEEKRSFAVHKNIICAHSPFFEAACSQRWATATPNPIALPEDDPEVFDIYLNCVYKNCVDVGNLEDPLPSEEHYHECSRVYLRLAKTYLLADKLQDVATTNLVMDEIIRYRTSRLSIPPRGVTAFIAGHTLVESPLRRFFVDLYVHQASLGAIQAAFGTDRLPQSFMFSVLEEKTRLDKENREKTIKSVFCSYHVDKPRCRYHQHDERHPRCGDQCEKGSDKDGK